jgi:hypothetical protein
VNVNESIRLWKQETRRVISRAEISDSGCNALTVVKNKGNIRIERKSRKETEELVVVRVDRSVLRSEAWCPLCLKRAGEKKQGK